MTSSDAAMPETREGPKGKLVPSVLMGIHYEVRPEVVVRWYEPGTVVAEQNGGGWYSEETHGFDLIPLTDVIVLSEFVADSWRAFCNQNVIVTRIVEDHLESALSAFDAAQEGNDGK